MKEALRPKKYRCEAEGCSKAYSRPCLLQQHRRTHSNSRPFKCDECGKGFFRETHLKVHVWVHAPDKPLKCAVCEKGFITNQQLGRHMKTHPTKFECPYECEEKFYTQKELTDHVVAEHILSDVVDVEAHQVLNEVNDRHKPCCTGGSASSVTTSTDGGSISTGITDPLTDPNRLSPTEPDYWENWGDSYCKEPSCRAYPSFESMFDLITHYDEGHKFVPETLCLYQYQLKDLDQHQHHEDDHDHGLGFETQDSFNIGSL